MGDMWNKHEELLGRGLTYSIWKNFPTHEIFTLKDANVGHGVMFDPANPPYVSAAALNGPVRILTEGTSSVMGLTWAQGGPGMRMLVSADNTDSAEVQWCGGGEPFIISDTAADSLELVYEVQFRISTVTANEMGLFIGLAGRHAMDSNFLLDNVPAANAPGVADIDMIGLFMDHADTTGLDIMYQIAGQDAVTHEAAWKTLTIDTWYIFGMRYKPSKKIDFYWGTGDRTTTKVAIDDNPITATTIATATFPDGQGLAPIIAIKGGTGDDEYLDVRTMACAQLAKAAN